MSALPEVVSAPDLGRVLGITPRYVQKLTKQGILTKDGHGQYPLAENVQAWVKSKVESELAKFALPESASSRKDDARARLLDLQIAEREHRLIDLDEATGVLDEVTGALKAELIGFPARVTRDLVLRSTIENEIDRVFGRAAARLTTSALALRAGGASPATAGADDA